MGGEQLDTLLDYLQPQPVVPIVGDTLSDLDRTIMKQFGISSE